MKQSRSEGRRPGTGRRVTGVQPGTGQHGRGGVWAGTPAWLARWDGGPGALPVAGLRARGIGGAGVRVLVIEDDGELAEAIGAGLRQERMAVDIAFDGADGLERVLMLTAAATIEDRADGLGLGADDYLPKPFAFAELVARLRALLRRAQPPHAPVLERGDLRLDPARRSASRAGLPLALGPKEFGVLELLLAAQGRVVSAEELLERVWDEMADPFTSAVKVTVSRLRRKLGDPPVIETLAQAGYRIAGDRA